MGELINGELFRVFGEGGLWVLEWGLKSEVMN